MMADKPHRTVWHMPRGAYALERGIEVVAIGWFRVGDLDRRYRPGDVVLLNPATLADLDVAAALPAAA